MKNSYASVAEYVAVFEPLLFEEVKAQIVQGRSSEEDGGLLASLQLPLVSVGFLSNFLVCMFVV